MAILFCSLFALAVVVLVSVRFYARRLRRQAVNQATVADVSGISVSLDINGNRSLFVLVAEGGDPASIVRARGLGALDDGDALAEIVARAIAADPDAAAKVLGGNEKAIGALIGPVMRETRGRADGAEVTRLIHEALAQRSS